MTLRPGATAEVARAVGPGDTAAGFGVVFPPAASTPFVLGLSEVACHQAVAAALAEGEITVGTRATIEHLRPSAIGATLTATAELRAHDGRRLDFAVDVRDGDELVAQVQHTRAVVDRERMLARLVG
jgi:fluoroacetyl-CoA thioesterase